MGCRVAAGGEVELVSLVHQLRDSRQVFFGDLLNSALQLKLLQEVVQRTGRGTQARAFRFHAVLIGASQILTRQGQRLEVAAAVQLAQTVKRRRSLFDYGNLGKLGTDPLAFEGVVIEEHETVQAQRQVVPHRA